MDDQPAVPTAHDRSFVPYPMGHDSQFEDCLPDMLVQEGGYSNDAHDPGGMTMEGIIQKEYDIKRRQWGLPTQWVKKISADEMRTIYYTDYWLPYCPDLPVGLDLEFFDLDVNGGPHRAVVTLQKALGVAQDGAFGMQTASALVAQTGTKADTEALIKRFADDREAFYQALSTFRYFGTGWTRRTHEIEAQGEKMQEKSGLDQALDDFTNHPPAPIMKDEPK